MIEMIRPDINIGYKKVEIPYHTVVLEYLKTIERRYSIIRIDQRTKQMLLSLDNLKDFSGKTDDYIACFCPITGNSFRSSGGLKLSSLDVRGSFIIEDSRIIYDPIERFYEERDFSKCNSSFFNTFYTTASMEDLLLDELKLDRDCFIYMGDQVTKKPLGWEEILKPSFQEELLDYAHDLKKGEKLYQKIITRKH